ncbi:L-fucose:H+ symporter permease [Mucilaginibacter sp.]|uniref:L-fucose:H+ symporter permease n=1 Tax=Mucilaginibacter sp. TaxID=1882438 RepID=UPI002639A2CE|nr:L-fucose:H+ symporter permease [Mucilaginibacter sp.]MDB4924128.1 fucP [Mucilaginibacter sp.]
MSNNTKHAFTERKYVVTLICVVSLFMMWGISMTMGDVLNKHFKEVLHISKSRSTLIQFSIFGAYAVMGIPAGLFMKRFGYKYGVLLGLLLFATGAFLFIPAADAASFTFFRVSLFILACGMATLETVAHPFAASLGSQETSAQRLNFAQGFNGIGGITGPVIGGYFILRAVQLHSHDLYSVKVVYTIIGCAILLIACGFFFLKIPDIREDVSNKANVLSAAPTEEAKPQSLKGLFKHRHFAWAILAQFCNVAAQGGTWAFFIIYGVEVMKLPADKAAYWFAFSMVLKTIGRFSGAFLLRYIQPNKFLATFATGSIIMCLIIAQSFGWVSFIALMMLNFFLSVMYPTIYSLGLKDLGPYKQQASSFIVMGVAGGAVFPYLMGLIADHNVATAYYLPIICYAFIVLFAVKLSRVSIAH